MGASHLEKGQGEVFTKKIRPPPPQIRLNLAKSNRNAFVSSSFDFTLVSLHLNVLAYLANCSKYRAQSVLQR